MSELSKSIAALADPSGRISRVPHVSSSWFVRAMAVAVTIIVGAAAWYAGRQSAQIGTSNLIAEMDRVQRESAKNRAELDNTRRQLESLSSSVAAYRNGTLVGDRTKLEKLVQRQEATIDQLAAALKRDDLAKAANTRLTSAFATPGVRVVSLKVQETAAHVVAYSIVTEAGRVVLVATGLPVPAGDRRYQLWLLRKEEPKVTDAGTFTVEVDGKTIFEGNSASPVMGITGISVTEEPQSGSAAPTSAPILTGSIEASQQ